MDYVKYLHSNVKLSYTGAGDNTVKKIREAEMIACFEKAVLGGYFRFGFGGIMAFNGKIYVRLSEREVSNLLKSTMQKLGVTDLYRVNSAKIMMNHLLDVLSAKPYTPNKRYIAFENGLLDLGTMGFMAHNEKCETNIYINHSYDKRANCKRFRSFLLEVLPNSDAVKVLQEFVGALFVDRKQFKIEKILYLLGGGANGKSVFTDTLTHVLGIENISTFELSGLVNKPENISMADGKLANICDDMSNTNVSGGNFKRFISGAPMPARFLFKDPYTATDLPMVIANVNEMPKTTDHTDGHHRRNIVIPFNRRFKKSEMDFELSDKLRKEASGILNWIFEGRARVVAQRGKFSESALIASENEKLRVDSNSALQFLQSKRYIGEIENAELYDEIWLSASDIHKKYTEWCDTERIRTRFEPGNFGRIMKSEGFYPKKFGGARGHRIYIRNLKKDPDEVEQPEHVQTDLPF